MDLLKQIKTINAPRSYIIFLLLIAGCAASTDESEQQAVKSTVNTATGYQDATRPALRSFGTVDYLGKKEFIERHTKPLPNKQYDIIDTYPDSQAKVRWVDPETPVLIALPQWPGEAERLKKWLARWDSIKQQESLADKYEKSYKKYRIDRYLELAAKIYKQNIADLLDLQKESWPNTDFAYYAYKKKISSCQLLDKLAARAYFEGLLIEKADEKACSYFP